MDTAYGKGNPYPPKKVGRSLKVQETYPPSFFGTLETFDHESDHDHVSTAKMAFLTHHLRNAMVPGLPVVEPCSPGSVQLSMDLAQATRPNVSKHVMARFRSQRVWEKKNRCYSEDN